MEAILNIPALDVALLDRVVQTAYGGKEPEGKIARDLLVQFQNHELAWTKADLILETSQNLSTKYLALSVLEDLIKTRWKILPANQRDGIKNFVVSLIIKLSQNEVTGPQRAFLSKLDMVLISIVKHEWPHNWPSFIPELVGSSNASESICENNMVILKLLSEEVFEFSAEQMVSQKVKDLKNEMCGSFSEVFQLCMLVLNRATRPSLINATLNTLLRFLNWIPLGYIFETDLIPMLVEKFFPVQQFRNATIKCLTEIAGINAGNVYDMQFVQLFTGTLIKLSTFMPPDMNLNNVFQTGSEQDQQFIQDLANFLTNILREHLRVIEAQDNKELLLQAHFYLINISDTDDRETFKVCLDYWNMLVSELYTELPMLQLSSGPLLLSGQGPRQHSARKQLYAPVLSKLRVVMIERMAKPEEVLVVENDMGEIVREMQKDTDTIALYKAMREVLIYLTHLDADDMEAIMQNKLLRQMDGSEWSWNNLSKLCWAIGSISGAMPEEEEKRFLVTVIKDLLSLVEMRRGKDNKAVVASNIMYIVGQYPRFLKAHWKFLKTVVNKLFEFMHELHEGVQDMACDTFIKIAQKCRKHFVVLQAGEVMPFIEEILINLPTTINELQPNQVHTFYEAVGYMIQSHPDREAQERLIVKLMELPNGGWDTIIQKARVDVRVLEEVATYKNVINILHTNVSACTAIGHPFIVQIGRIFMDLLNLYRATTQLIGQQVLARGNAPFVQTATIKGLRGIKRQSLRLLDTFISKCEDHQVVAETFVPPLLEAILVDYSQTMPEVREADVLNLCATIVQRLNAYIQRSIHPILDSVFACTLEMIAKDFQEFPEHRTGFYRLLREVNFTCFASVLELPPQQFELFVNSIVWGFKHTMRDIADVALQIMHELLTNMDAASAVHPAAVAQFYQRYLLTIIQDIFAVLTDRMHKSGFKMQAVILAHIFHLVESGRVPVPLWDPSQQQQPGMTNQVFLRTHMATLLRGAFAQVSDQQIQTFVAGLFDLNMDITAFKSSLRDFLIQLKEFAGEDNRALFTEETEAELERKRQANMLIPGMIKPHERPDDGME